VISASLGGAVCPPACAAQFTRMSTRPPSAAAASVIIALTEASLLVSTTTGTIRCPVASASSAAVS
jgi:hypothetical protein